jgi:hypothetical protein
MWFIYNIFVGSFGDDMLTRRAREGVDALEKNKIILLTGIDGIGKTFTAEKIIKLYCGKHHDFDTVNLSNLRRLQVKPVIDYFLLDMFQTDGEKLIVFMDDFLANHYVKYLKEDLRILKIVYRTKCECPGTVEVVLTVDNSCIEWCKEELEQCGLLSEVYLIDLNEEFNNTEDLQEQLLKEHLPGEDHRDIVEKYRRAQEPKIGFPELCYLFSKNNIFRDQGADFFQDPSKSLDEYFMKLGSNKSSMEENVFYIALVQIMMTNKLVVFDIPRAEINNNMQNMFHILYKKTLDVQSIEPIIDKTNCGILIKTSENRDGMYIFQNPLIRNFLFNSFIKIISPLGLENVLGFFTMEFIVDFVRTHLNHQSIYPNTVLFVKEELYPLLAVGIMKIIYENGKDSVNRLCLSPLLDNNKFLHILLKESRKQTYHSCHNSLSFYSSDNTNLVLLHAVLLESVMKYLPSTAIVNILLDDMSTTLRLQSHPAVVGACKQSVKFAMTEACKANCIEQIEILGQFITEHNTDYSGSSFLREAFINQGNEAVTWILDNIPIPHKDVLSILLHLENESKFNKDRLEWCIEHIYPVEHNTSRHELNTFNIYESIADICQENINLDLVEYMWTFYKVRIIRNYCSLFPDIEESVALRSVLGKLMKASQKISNPSLVIWWVNTEGTQNFDMTAVKAYLRGVNKDIPPKWIES